MKIACAVKYFVVHYRSSCHVLITRLEGSIQFDTTTSRVVTKKGLCQLKPRLIGSPTSSNLMVVIIIPLWQHWDWMNQYGSFGIGEWGMGRVYTLLRNAQSKEYLINHTLKFINAYFSWYNYYYTDINFVVALTSLFKWVKFEGGVCQDWGRYYHIYWLKLSVLNECSVKC